MTFLLDVNVLYILHQPLHPDYRIVHRWFASKSSDAFATCSITQTGLARLLMQSIGGLDRFSYDDVRNVLEALAKHPRHVFWPDAPPYLDITGVLATRIQGHRQITDSYLVGLAIRNKATLATLDSGIRQLAGAEFGSHVELIQ